MKKYNQYIVYLRYEKILKLIGKKQCTALDILKKTKIPIASLYRILNSLLNNNRIIISETKKPNKMGRPTIIFKLNRGKQK